MYICVCIYIHIYNKCFADNSNKVVRLQQSSWINVRRECNRLGTAGFPARFPFSLCASKTLTERMNMRSGGYVWGRGERGGRVRSRGPAARTRRATGRPEGRKNSVLPVLPCHSSPVRLTLLRCMRSQKTGRAKLRRSFVEAKREVFLCTQLWQINDNMFSTLSLQPLFLGSAIVFIYFYLIYSICFKKFKKLKKNFTSFIEILTHLLNTVDCY